MSYSSYQTAADASVDILDGERQRLLIPEPSDDVDDDVEGKEITVVRAHGTQAPYLRHFDGLEQDWDKLGQPQCASNGITTALR